MTGTKELTADKLRVRVLEGRDSMGREAAKTAGAILRALLAEQAEVNVIFAAAPSQNETLLWLTREDGIDWTRVNAFHMDEYLGLPDGAPQRFGEYLRAHIFSKVPFKKIYYLNGAAADAQEECERYSALLRQYPVDLVCLGIGENGHIAFNDPGVAMFDDPKLVKTVPLDEICRQQQVHDGCFATLSAVPTHAMTLTIPALTAAAHMVCTVPAATKKAAVTATVLGKISEQVPATVLRQHPDAYLFCDPESGAGLPEHQ